MRCWKCLRLEVIRYCSSAFRGAQRDAPAYGRRGHQVEPGQAPGVYLSSRMVLYFRTFPPAVARLVVQFDTWRGGNCIDLRL